MSDVTGVSIDDLLPVQLDPTSTWSAVYANGATSETLGNGGVGNISGTVTLLGRQGIFTSKVTITIVGKVLSSATGDMTNTVTADSSFTDPVSASDTNTMMPAAQLSILKVDSATKVTAGAGTIQTYTITVSNVGVSDAQNVTVVDTWPTGFFTPVPGSFLPSQGSILPPAPVGDFTWLVGTLPASGTAVLTAQYTVPAVTPLGFYTNTVVASSQSDPGSPVTASVTTEVDNSIIPTGGEPVLVLGTDDGCNIAPIVRVLDKFGEVVAVFDPSNGLYESTFRGSVRVTTGDVTGDGVADIVVAPGRNRVGQIRVFVASGTGASTVYTYDPRFNTRPFGTTYTGGVEVAVGDVNADGINDIIAGQSSGEGLVRAFLVNTVPGGDPVANTPYRSFRGFAAPYTGGVMIAAADFNNDGFAEIIVGSNAGIRAKVKVFDVIGTPTVVRSIKPFADTFTGGVTLSVGRYATTTVPDDGIDDIFVGTGVGGTSLVEFYSGSTGAKLGPTLAAFSSFAKTNARVFTAGLDLNGDGEVDNVYGVKGLNGGGGATGVRQYDRVTEVTSDLTSAPSLTPPLRIAPIVRSVLRQSLRLR
jgi:uncharacterized repeat protein (TIGR01451 family)